MYREGTLDGGAEIELTSRLVGRDEKDGPHPVVDVRLNYKMGRVAIVLEAEQARELGHRLITESAVDNP